MSKHTEGPWEVNGGFVEAEQGGVTIYTGIGYRGKRPMPDDEIEANARTLDATYAKGQVEQMEVVFAEIKKCRWLEVDHETGPMGCKLGHECVCQPIAQAIRKGEGHE